MEQEKIDATVKVATAIGEYLATVQDNYSADREVPLSRLCELKNTLNEAGVKNALNEADFRCELGSILLKTKAFYKSSGANLANEALRIYTREEKTCALDEMLAEIKATEDMDTLFPVPGEERKEFLCHFFVTLEKAWGAD